MPSQFRSKLSALLIGVTASAVLLAGLELILGVLNPLERGKHEERILGTREFPLSDLALGFKPRADSEAIRIKERDGEALYKTKYTFDEFSRRLTPAQEAAGRGKFILFFGGSITFGEGVKDFETMPFFVSRVASQYRAYNYGFSGYGPQQMLVQLSDPTIRDQVKEQDGIAVYTFIGSHVKRAIGAMDVHNAWGAQMPHFVLEGGQFVRKGNFTTGRPFRAELYKALGKSQIVRRFKINIPLRITDRHIRFTAQMIAACRDLFREKFGSDRFYTVIYPQTEYSERLISYLKEFGVKYFDYSNLLDLRAEGLRIKVDEHPTGKAHALIAAELVRDLDIWNPVSKQA